MCFGLLFDELCMLDEADIGCEAEAPEGVGGVGAFEGGSGTPLGSEFLREGESVGLPMCGVLGAEAGNTWLALREEKGKRLEDDDPADGDSTGEAGCSWSGVGGQEMRTGEGERRAGRAERKRPDGRLEGDGACVAGRHIPRLMSNGKHAEKRVR